jgi:hypothetical protein
VRACTCVCVCVCLVVFFVRRFIHTHTTQRHPTTLSTRTHPPPTRPKPGQRRPPFLRVHGPVDDGGLDALSLEARGEGDGVGHVGAEGDGLVLFWWWVVVFWWWLSSCHGSPECPCLSFALTILRPPRTRTRTHTRTHRDTHTYIFTYTSPYLLPPVVHKGLDDRGVAVLPVHRPAQRRARIVPHAHAEAVERHDGLDAVGCVERCVCACVCMCVYWFGLVGLLFTEWMVGQHERICSTALHPFLVNHSNCKARTHAPRMSHKYPSRMPHARSSCSSSSISSPPNPPSDEIAEEVEEREERERGSVKCPSKAWARETPSCLGVCMCRGLLF